MIRILRPVWRLRIVTLAVVMVGGAAAPALATKLQPLWQLDSIAGANFSAVCWLVSALGYDVVADPVRKAYRLGRLHDLGCARLFRGIALVTIFVSLYLWLFRAELRFPYALLPYPLGIAASACLNVVRIGALLVLGIKGQPDLAVGGFHSHAGG